MLDGTDFDKANQQVNNLTRKNKGFFVNWSISWLFYLSLLFQVERGVASESDNMADLQIFGDIFIPPYVAAATGTTATFPAIFAASQRLLDSSQLNIANFEGVATAAFVPFELKKFLLRMPTWVTLTLKSAGIDAVTLANNHSLDYGVTGLMDSIDGLTKAGIESFGAGENLEAAARPIFLPLGGRVACLFSMTRTLPESFWATERTAGTAFLNDLQTRLAIERCSKQNYFTIVIYHWGQEMTQIPRMYQTELARLSIDAGADVVIGHHPHILQKIDSYKGKPIFYSIGNFAFGSDTKTSPQEGMAVRIRLPEQSNSRPIFALVPINVQNSDVRYIPRLYPKAKTTPLDRLIPRNLCKRNYSTDFGGSYYECNFSQETDSEKIRQAN